MSATSKIITESIASGLSFAVFFSFILWVFPSIWPGFLSAVCK